MTLFIGDLYYSKSEQAIYFIPLRAYSFLFICLFFTDSVAYIGLAQSHISVMVAVDPATEENGCLFVAPGQVF
jgi:hypothetical protein